MQGRTKYARISSMLAPLLWGVFKVEIPEAANGALCVDLRELHRLTADNMTLAAFVNLYLPLAGVAPAAPWRDLTDHATNIAIPNSSRVLLTLDELGKVLPIIRGYQAKRLRLALRREGWPG